MKKIMTVMLGMSLLFGTVSLFAGDSTTTTAKTTKTKKTKAKKTTGSTTTSKM
jgi:hypothetical protein